MSAVFLSDKQARQYGRFTAVPTPEQLARYFYLDLGADHQFVQEQTRMPHNRLGLAGQLGTVRFFSTLLADLSEVPDDHHAGRFAVGRAGWAGAFRALPGARHDAPGACGVDP